MRDKEEELEVAMQKIDSLRHEIRKSEKMRRELEARVEDGINEANKVCLLVFKFVVNLLIMIMWMQERKLRERSEELCRQTRLECEAVAARGGQLQDTITTPSAHKEVASLRNEVERLEVFIYHWYDCGLIKNVNDSIIFSGAIQWIIESAAVALQCWAIHSQRAVAGEWSA